MLAGSAEKAWALVTVLFIAETAAVGILHPKTVNVINRTHQQARIETHCLRYHDNILLDCF